MPGVLERISTAKRRIQSILDREIVANQKTLEQKIAEQGPDSQRVDPHLIGLAIFDLLELRRLVKHTHKETGTVSWYTNLGTEFAKTQVRLNELAPLYASVSGRGFGNLTGDALELIIFKCLDNQYSANKLFAYQGHFQLNAPKNNDGRYKKTSPPKHIGKNSTKKEADFLLFGYALPLCIECKNLREWVYPRDKLICDLIIRSFELDALPILIARRLHYTTRTNFLEPAGIIAHESYFQYYPADKEKIATQVKDKRKLGFTDVTASEEPHPRTIKFITEILPKIISPMLAKWSQNKASLLEYALGEINLAQLYNSIGSPASGNWKNPEDMEDHE